MLHYYYSTNWKKRAKKCCNIYNTRSPWQIGKRCYSIKSAAILHDIEKNFFSIFFLKLPPNRRKEYWFFRAFYTIKWQKVKQAFLFLQFYTPKTSPWYCRARLQLCWGYEGGTAECHYFATSWLPADYYCLLRLLPLL